MLGILDLVNRGVVLLISPSLAFIRCISYWFYLRCSIKGAFSHSSLSILPFSVKKKKELNKVLRKKNIWKAQGVPH